jgi:outer membrane protein assembly factor BamB
MRKTTISSLLSAGLLNLLTLSVALTPAMGVAAETSTIENSLPATITHSRVLPGTGESWGFAAQDPTRPYLFIARRDNGLTVFDVEKQQVVRTLDNSVGANAVVFVAGADRAYITNMDGSVTVVRLSDLTTLKRIAVADANLNSAIYEPVSRHVIIASGRRAGRSTLYVLDPQLDRIVAQQDVDVKKIDPLLATGDGNVLLPMRDEGKVMRLSGKTLKADAVWEFEGCKQPSALAIDTASRRLFIACRGTAPILAVADLDTGTLKATLPITHDVNALGYDARLHRIVIPSGTDANLTVIRQSGPDHYRTLGFTGTRLWAHNMVYDQQRAQVYLLAMDFTQPATGADGIKQSPRFHANTFTVLTLGIKE